MSLTEATLTLPDYTKFWCMEPSLSSVRRSVLNMKSLLAKMFLTEKAMYCVTRPSSLRRSRTRRSNLARLGVSSTMLLTCIVRSLTTRTTSILQPRTSPSFINTDGRSSCSSNESSNTSRSSLSGERATMRCVFRFMMPSSHTVSSELLSTTSSMRDPSCRS